MHRLRMAVRATSRVRFKKASISSTVRLLSFRPHPSTYPHKALEKSSRGASRVKVYTSPWSLISSSDLETRLPSPVKARGKACITRRAEPTKTLCTTARRTAWTMQTWTCITKSPTHSCSVDRSTGSTKSTQTRSFSSSIRIGANAQTTLASSSKNCPT